MRKHLNRLSALLVPYPGIPYFLMIYGIFLMYFPVITHDYLMNDEMRHIGLLSYTTLPDFLRYQFVDFSRGLFGVFLYLVYGFAGYSPFRVILLRTLMVAGVSVLAVLLYRWLVGRGVGKFAAFFTTLYLFALLPVQGITAYSLNFLATLPAFFLSIGSFAYFFSKRSKASGGMVSSLTVFVLLFLAMQTQHTFAFVSYIPLTYLILTDWPSVARKALRYGAITVVAILFSIGLYKATLATRHAAGLEGYGNGEEAMTTLENPQKLVTKALAPDTYWTAFELWTYPITTPNLGAVKRSAAVTVLYAWAAFVAACIIRELLSLRHAWRAVLAKWGTALLSMGFSAMFLPVDSVVSAIGEHRPHVAVTLTGIIVLVSLYIARSFARALPFLRTPFIWLIFACAVLVTSFGAYRNVSDAIVLNRVRQLDFVRQRFGQAPSPVITVVLPESKPCIFEPCNLWMGGIPSMLIHLSTPGWYRYAVYSLGFDPRAISIRAIYPSDPVPKDGTIIDWNEYTRTQADIQKRE